MFSGIQSYVIAGLALTLLIVGGMGYWYFSYSQREMATLRENAAKLEQAVQTQQQTIQAQQEAHERSNQLVLQLQNRLSGAERSRRDLEVRLRQQNLESGARTRRQETEREINSIMQGQWSTFERLSGHTPAPTPPTTNSPPAATPTPLSGDQPPPRPPVRGPRP